MSQQQILLVENDRKFGDVLKSYLEMHQYDVTLATDEEIEFETFKNGIYDLCLFDVMMSKKDGLTLGKRIKDDNPKVPVLFLTDKSLKQDVIHGFKIGADDYITKPFDSRELLFRVQTVLTKPSAPVHPNADKKEFVIGDYLFNYPLRTLIYKAKGVKEKKKLSPKEAHLLRLLCLHMNDVLLRSKALIEIWGEDDYFAGRSMDVYVTKLRKYLNKDSNLKIVNIHGSGFQLVDKYVVHEY